jgi:hypothetical protein
VNWNAPIYLPYSIVPYYLLISCHLQAIYLFILPPFVSVYFSFHSLRCVRLLFNNKPIMNYAFMNYATCI